MYEIDSAGVDPAVKAPGYFLCTHIAMHAESIEINTDSLRMHVYWKVSIYMYICCLCTMPHNRHCIPASGLLVWESVFSVIMLLSRFL